MGAAKKHGPAAYLGIDVGKSRHSACALDAAGGVVFRADLDNRPDAIDRLLERAGDAALVVVDQKRNIGALVLARAHALGRRCAYLPGYAEKRARDMMPGIAKTDAIDAEVIARTAMGMPQALRPIAAEDAAARSLRVLSSQHEYAVASRTRAKNRFRAGREGQGALGGARRVGGVREGRRRGRGRLGAHAGARDIRTGLRRRRARRAHRRGAGRRRGLREPAHDTRHRVEDRRGAGHRGRHLAVREPPRAGELLRGGTRIRSTSPQRGGNKQLKNLLIFSCNSLVGTGNRFGRYYDECRARGMRHNKALKAVARKRMKVVYAIMRDAVPYEPRR